jgi:transcriptional antiterminator Rof (Rho-off)
MKSIILKNKLKKLFFCLFSFRCTLSNQSEKIHYEEMVQAYTNAKNEYLQRHPEAHDMVLRYDPISHLTKPLVSSTTTT